MHSTPALSRLRHFQLSQFHGLSLITRYKRIQLRSEASSTPPSTALSQAPAQTSEAQEQGRYAGSTWFVMKGETQWIKLWSWSITTKKVRCLSQSSCKHTTWVKDILGHQTYSRRSLVRHKKVKTGVHEPPKEN